MAESRLSRGVKKGAKKVIHTLRPGRPHNTPASGGGSQHINPPPPFPLPNHPHSYPPAANPNQQAHYHGHPGQQSLSTPVLPGPWQGQYYDPYDPNPVIPPPHPSSAGHSSYGSGGGGGVYPMAHMPQPANSTTPSPMNHHHYPPTPPRPPSPVLFPHPHPQSVSYPPAGATPVQTIYGQYSPTQGRDPGYPWHAPSNYRPRKPSRDG